VLARDSAGHLSLAGGNGSLTAFNPDGTLASVTSATDDRGLAAPTYTWGAPTGSPMASRITAINDPVGNRHITLNYGGDAACPTPPSGFAAPPRAMLCLATYWDGTQTRYWYNPGGQLARIEDPSGSITDFAYDANGRLAQVRTPLVADAVAAGVITYDDTPGSARTVITYDAQGRAASVNAPTPTSGAARPGHTYQYVSATETRVHVAGLDESQTGFARKVTLDAAGRWLSDTDATNKTGSATWDGNPTLGPVPDRQLSATDPAGRMTTTIYDVEGRPTDIYGPAPASCFGSDRRPTASCPGLANGVAHTANVYDTDASDVPIPGLAAAYWNNPTMAGAPTRRITGVGSATGALQATWSAPPDPGLGSSWSARYTGEIIVDAARNLNVVAPGATLATIMIDDSAVTASTSVPAGTHRIEIDQTGPSTGIELDWRPAGAGTFVVVPGTALRPRYGLVTKATTDDATPGSPASVSRTAYGSPGGWPDPAMGLVTSSTVDPTGAALVTAAAYEPSAPGNFLRPLSRTLPAGNATTATYYANTQVVANPCPAGGSANQAGRLRLTSAPSPDGGGTPGWTTEAVYDAAGRVAATRRNTDPWTCLAYDARGRVLTEAVPALPAPLNTPARTATIAYSVAGDPRSTTVADSAGIITSTIDLLGRVVSYTDAWGNVTTSTYDQPGRLTDTVGRDGTRHVVSDSAGRPLTQSLDGTVLATATYDPTSGELASVTYNGNGTALASIGRDPAGRTTALNFNQAGTAGSLVTDAVGRSQSGRVVTETVDGSAASAFTYDAPGRLTAAAIPGHSLAYSFAATGNCGLAPKAGTNTNRTAVADNAGTAITSCYNQADQLTSSSDTAVGTPTYDAHGNTKTMGTQTLTYDGSDRHVATTTGTTTVTYVRDATGRIISRAEAGTTVRYGFDGPGSGSSFTTDTTGLIVGDRTVSLVGGVLVTKRSTGDVWSYPNIHGDMVATADPAGAKRGGTLSYDPFGTALTSGPNSPDGVPDNSAGNLDYGWLGQAQSGLEHAPGIATIEMGARPYVPGTGRFLQVDPVEGGSCNSYDYVCGDPVNGLDVTGRTGHKPLPDRDGECLGGNERQLNNPECVAYRQAKVTGDSDFYYKGKTLTAPGKPNAFLTAAGPYVGDALLATAVGAGAASIFVSGPVGAGLAASGAIAYFAIPTAGSKCPGVRLAGHGASGAVSLASTALLATPDIGPVVIAGAKAASAVSTGTAFLNQPC
jgi:RHS repeat-associated protein